MIGPVERALRERLVGEGISRDDARRQLGPLAIWHWDRLARSGAIEPADAARWRLKQFKVDPAVLAARRAQAAQAARRRTDFLDELAARRKAEEERRQRYQQHLRLFDGLEGYPKAERSIVIEERIAALQESSELRDAAAGE